MHPETFRQDKHSESLAVDRLMRSQHEGKGIAKAVRSKLAKFLAPHFRQAGGGSIQGSSLDYPVAG